MSRYSLNLRSKYRPDEPTTGGGIAAGIQTALDEVQKYREADREEQNAMGAAGARRTKAPPTPGERVRGIGRAIGGLFGRDEDSDPNDADDRAPLRPTGTFAPVTPPVTPPGVGPGIAPVAPRIDRSRIESMAGNAPMQPMAPGLTPEAPVMPTPATNTVAAARPSIANALQGEIQPYTYKGVHGAEYTVDPLYGARVKAAGGEFDEQRKIQSLIDAGMDPKEARARVLNNVVKYDDTFGQQSRAGSRISDAEWTRRENMRYQHQQQLEADRRAGRITQEQFTERRLKLQEEAQADRRLRGDVTTELSIAGAIDRTIQKDPIALSTETDAQRAQREKAERERGSHINAAVDANTRRKNGSATREQAAARAKALKNQGLSDDEIRSRMKSEGYNIQ